MVANVWANCNRQRPVDFRLVVIENGEAVGAWARYGLQADAVLTSGQSAAAAKNEGLTWIRAHGGGSFATFDDDDYYGPGYLEEALAALENGERVVGKSAVFVLTQVGRLRAVLGWPENARTDCLVHGPTICGVVEDAVDFPLVAVGEDTEWVLAMRRRGFPVWSTSHFRFCYRRAADVVHTLVTEDDALLRCWQRGGGRAYDYGEWDAEVVDGVLEVVPAEINLGAYQLSDNPGACAAADALGWTVDDMAACPVTRLGDSR
jgi:hypothetical protein